MYILIIVIVILVAAGAIIALSIPASKSYDIVVTVQRNGSGTVYPYQSSALLVRLTNNGSSTVSGIPVGFYVNGAQTNYTTYTILPHQTLNITENYTYGAAGPYLFQVVTDPGNVLDISDRGASKASLYINATAPKPANVYLSIPNSNITFTESFSSSGVGLYTITKLDGTYYLPPLSDITGFDKKVLPYVFEDLYTYVVYANGAYAEYKNGTSAYTAWLQGPVDLKDIGLVLSSFNIKLSATTGPAGPLLFARLGNTISLCSYYSGGWTKVTEFYNESLPSTCENLATSNYSANESNTLIAVLKSNANLTKYRSGFLYLNSTGLGSVVSYDGNNTYLTNVFQNTYGVFTGSILYHQPSNVLLLNSTCGGLIYSSNGVSVCSTVVPQLNGEINQSYGLVDSKYLTDTYTIDMYSLVADSQLIGAHDNAAHLIGKLGVNQTSLQWQPRVKNSCTLNDSSLGCSLLSFNASTNVATISVTDINYSKLGLTAINCEAASGFRWTLLNYTMSKGQTLNISIACSTLPIPGFAAASTYNLGLNVTGNGKSSSLNGTITVAGVSI